MRKDIVIQQLKDANPHKQYAKLEPVVVKMAMLFVGTNQDCISSGAKAQLCFRCHSNNFIMEI